MVEASSSSSGSVKILFISVPLMPIEKLLEQLGNPLQDPHDVVYSQEQYDALPNKYEYDCIGIPQGTPVTLPILRDQVINNSKLRWVQSMRTGIDEFLSVAELKASAITLSNIRGVWSDSLGEFVAQSMIYFTKRIEDFMNAKAKRQWNPGFVDLCKTKVVAIIGYGDIGAKAGRICRAFGTKVIAVKRRPEQLPPELREHCDELVSNDELDRVYAEADFVVGILPGTPATVNFFTMESCFSKMKPSGVFVSLGRGDNVNEPELIEALKSKRIAGASLDVFSEEPLSPESELWDLPNVYMSPHCAVWDPGFLVRSVEFTVENIARFKAGEQVQNICEKEKGY